MMDIEHLADALAGRDAHLTLDIPLELADALRRLLADRESTIASLRGQLASAELEILNRVRVISVLTGEVPTPIEHVDPAWLMTLRHAGAL